MTVHSTDPSPILQPTIGRLRLPRVRPAMLASAVAIGTATAALPAIAQQSAQQSGQQTGQQMAGDQPATLPAISVEGQKATEDTGNSYKAGESASPKFTAPLLDTPKSVTVITKEEMEDRGAQSLKDVLRTTPGISLGSGEGGTAIGDRPFIRGFDALTDTFIDGIRDNGAQSRETFNLEQVEVIKGPGSAYTGRGSTGGSLNLISKTAKAENFEAGSVTLGTDMTKRATVDVNHVIDDNIAFRINALLHDGDVAGRDDVDITKFGFAPTVTFGLKKDTRITLSYYHLQTDGMPDYGHPFDPTTGKPVDVDRDNFYGLKARDFQKTYYDGVTASVEHDLNSGDMLRNTTRYSYSENKYIVTKPDWNTGTNAAPVNILPSGQVERESRSRNADNITVANVTELSGERELAGYKNSYVAGVELDWESSKNRGYTIGAASNASLYDPNADDAYTGTISPSTSFTNTVTRTTSTYVLDTVTLHPQWDVNLGLRLDHYGVDSRTQAADLSNESTFLNYQSGIVYKPLPFGSIYVSYGTSSNPAGGAGGEGGDSGNLSTAVEDLSPEKNRSYELGTKWDLLNKAISLTAAVFRTEKDNARVTDAAGNTVNAGEQRVDGFEIGLSGSITPAWKVFGGYTYLNSELVNDGAGTNDGHDFPYIAPHNVSLWTTYDIDQSWKIGGGAIYTDRRYANTANTYKLPPYWRFDLMAAYKINQNVDVQLNVQNLFDETYYDATHAGQFANVAPGRVALLTTNFKF